MKSPADTAMQMFLQMLLFTCYLGFSWSEESEPEQQVIVEYQCPSNCPAFCERVAKARCVVVDESHNFREEVIRKLPPKYQETVESFLHEFIPPYFVERIVSPRKQTEEALTEQQNMNVNIGNFSASVEENIEQMAMHMNMSFNSLAFMISSTDARNFLNDLDDLKHLMLSNATYDSMGDHVQDLIGKYGGDFPTNFTEAVVDDIGSWGRLKRTFSVLLPHGSYPGGGNYFGGNGSYPGEGHYFGGNGSYPGEGHYFGGNGSYPGGGNFSFGGNGSYPGEGNYSFGGNGSFPGSWNYFGGNGPVWNEESINLTRAEFMALANEKIMAFIEMAKNFLRGNQRFWSEKVGGQSTNFTIKVWQASPVLYTCEGFVKTLTDYVQLPHNNFTRDFFTDPSSFPISFVETLPKYVFELLPEPGQREVIAKLSSIQKATFCKNLRLQSCVIRENVYRHINCRKAFRDEEMQLDLSREDLRYMINIEYIKTWAHPFWNTVLQNYTALLTPAEFAYMPPDLMLQNLGSIAQICKLLDLKKVQYIGNAVKKLLANKVVKKPEWSAGIQTFVKNCGGDPSLMEGFLNVQETLRTVDLSKLNEKQAARFMEKNLQNMDMQTLTADEIKNSIKVLAMNKTFIMNLDENQLKDSLCHICSNSENFKNAELRSIGSAALRKIPSIQDFSSMNETTLSCIRCLIPFFPKTAVKQISDDTLKSALESGSIKSLVIQSRSMGQNLIKNAKEVFSAPEGNFSASNLKQMGSTILSFGAADIEKIPSESFDPDVLNVIDDAMRKGSVKMSKASKNKILRKALQGAGIQSVLKTSLAKSVPVSKLASTSADDFEELLANASDISFSIKQTRTILRKIKNKYGPVTSNNTAYSLESLLNWKPILCGFSVEDIRNLPRNEDLPAILKLISESPCLKPHISVTLYEVYKEYFEFENKTSQELANFATVDTINALSPQILAQHSLEELQKYEMSNCEQILDQLSVANTKLLSLSQSREIWDYGSKCKNFSTADHIELEDLTNLDTFICGINVEDVVKLDQASIDQFAVVLDKCPLSSAVREAAVSTIVTTKNLTGADIINTADVLILGTFFADLSTELQNKIPLDMYDNLGEQIMNAFKERMEVIQERLSTGYKADIDPADVEKLRQARRRIAIKIIQAKLAASSSSRRKKRSAGSLTCEDLQVLGTEALPEVSAENLGKLSAQDFLDCADLFGEVDGFSSEQRQALFDVAVTADAWGSFSSWPTNTLFTAGSLLQVLTPEEIAVLNLDLETASRMGTFSSWTGAQLAAIFERWLDLEQKVPGNITDSDLRLLGNVVCGASAAQITAMDSNAYGQASETVGEVKYCSQDKLEAFLQLAKGYFGTDVTSWDIADVTIMGVVIVALPKEEFSQLDSTQLSALDAQIISQIPPATIAALSSAQISEFSMAQAQSTTKEQRSSMSSAQLQALSAAANIDYSSGGSSQPGDPTQPKDNSPPTQTPTLLWMPLTMLLLILLQ